MMISSTKVQLSKSDRQRSNTWLFRYGLQTHFAFYIVPNYLRNHHAKDEINRTYLNFFHNNNTLKYISESEPIASFHEEYNQIR